jgi:hypothetical protein
MRFTAASFANSPPFFCRRFGANFTVPFAKSTTKLGFNPSLGFFVAAALEDVASTTVDDAVDAPESSLAAADARAPPRVRAVTAAPSRRARRTYPHPRRRCC